MELKLCPDCGLQFVASLNACPKCGCPADVCTPVESPEDSTTEQQPVAQQPTQTAPLAPQPAMPQPVVIDYKLRRKFFFIAGGFSVLGALTVLRSTYAPITASTHWALFFALLSAGLTLIGMGASIKS